MTPCLVLLLGEKLSLEMWSKYYQKTESRFLCLITMAKGGRESSKSAIKFAKYYLHSECIRVIHRTLTKTTTHHTKTKHTCNRLEFQWAPIQPSTEALYLHLNFDSLSPLTLNCEIPSMNSAKQRPSTCIIDMAQGDTNTNQHKLLWAGQASKPIQNGYFWSDQTANPHAPLPFTHHHNH